LHIFWFALGVFDSESVLLTHTQDDLTDTWDDIELEPDVKTTAMQMVDLNLFNPKSAYGLLKNNRIDGLLLYGPPGTGKTQLARVMAWESKAAMIHVSPADITTKWVGETEKFIKALFNLAKMLFPCIIFIDESDSLFRARSEGDRSWERAQTNQLLLEVDGLRKENTRPFVMLATNHPQYLDPAVLRRVPCRLYVGFPMRQAREKIFNIYLQEEERHSDVDIDMLAGKTRRYTGSDLRYVCIRAAQLCEVELRASDAPDPKRILKMIHFEKALQDIAPSVSEEAMGDLRAFARKFDTHALSRIRLEPAEAQPRQMNTLTARETTKRNAQVSISIDEQHTAKRRMVSTRTPSQMVEEMMKELPYSTPFY
jgi:SpoVK/Ycf46/Vps4 family AAA+-type ATPase